MFSSSLMHSRSDGSMNHQELAELVDYLRQSSWIKRHIRNKGLPLTLLLFIRSKGRRKCVRQLRWNFRTAPSEGCRYRTGESVVIESE